MAFNWFKRSYEEPEEPAKASEPEQAEQTEQTKAAPASSEDYLNWAKAAYQNIQARQTEAPAEIADSDETVDSTDAVIDAVVGDRSSESPASEPEEAVEDFPAVSSEELTREISDETSAPEAALETSEDNADVAPETIEPETVEPETVEALLTETVSDDAEASAISPEAASPTAAVPPVEAAASAPDTASADGSPAETVTDSPAPAQPFWAKAQAEREARLERLQAEAILEPAPEPEPAASQPEFEPLDIDLDEAFLWSAEVLAAQGRRADQISLEEITWLNKLRQGLDKTRRGLVNQLKAIVGQGPLNDAAVDEIEALLLQADVGVSATDYIISALQTRLTEETLPPEQAISYLKSLLRDMLDAPLAGGHNLTFTPEKDRLSIWLMTGVNGAGKTTTIGKIAHIATKSGFSCLIGAADTFRAAAVEQVKVWGARSGVEVIANPGQNTDPAAVVFDAISAATSRNIELLLIDTAGRLQNKKNLMDELSKVRRIIDKKAPDASVESLLVLDATLGQNGLRQAQVFSEAAQLSGVVLTKLDGTARGGVALAVVQQLGLPIRFIGAGEGIEDLRPFSSYEFVEALLSG
ncbi:signal recognition particle-docking protein FtsY [Leptolyngbya sp. BC1307]|uniref:signal recognition particle-docking protein FtsY n=1 Tax=Leptolyngbya sp. BC1307 TaxID=2029589 RepID=UPI000EFCAB97|nr:signal recognition particle-docking protein FtsY [Leptolyngbya sp. BC1307]